MSKEAVKNTLLELRRLKLADITLISKRKRYMERLELAGYKGKKYETQLSKFDEQYWELREKVGKKRIKFQKELIDLVGKPKSIKLNTEKIDNMLKDIW